MKPCRHEWEIVSQSFEPPPLWAATVPSGADLGGLQLLRLLALGHTDVSLRCRSCGDAATRVLEGRWRDAGALAENARSEIWAGAVLDALGRNTAAVEALLEGFRAEAEEESAWGAEVLDVLRRMLELRKDGRA